MNPTRIVASAVVFSCACVFAAGSGEVVQQGTSTKLVEAYACQQPDHFDKSKMLTSVMISSKAIDAAKASSNCAQLRTLLGKYVELDFAPDKSLDMIGIYERDVGFSTGATDTLTLTRYDDKRIEGTYRTKDEMKKNSEGAYFDLTFAVDAPAVKH